MRQFLVAAGLGLAIATAAFAQDNVPDQTGDDVIDDGVMGVDTTDTQPFGPAPEGSTLVDEERPRPFDAEIDGAENLPSPVPDAQGNSRIAVIRGLDKITALVRDVQVPVGVPVMFESFEILVQTCSKRPPEETPETTAFVQVTEHRLDDTLERIFSGWMFASTPAINPVEHPVYDVWLIDCITL